MSAHRTPRQVPSAWICVRLRGGPDLRRWLARDGLLDAGAILDLARGIRHQMTLVRADALRPATRVRPLARSLNRRDKRQDTGSRFLGQCAILGSATGTCCASGGASWLEVEAPPSLPNRCLHLAQTADAGLIFDGELSYGQPQALRDILPAVRAKVSSRGCGTSARSFASFIRRC
jgi:hypothetical protein